MFTTSSSMTRRRPASMPPADATVMLVAVALIEADSVVKLEQG
jgi:hypothetical protein